MARYSRRGSIAYSDGKRTHYADFLSVYRSLDAHPKFLISKHLEKAYHDGDAEAIEVTASAVREAFGIPIYTGPKQPGLTDVECVDLAAGVWNYAQALKKNTPSSAISPATTDATFPGSAERREPPCGSCVGDPPPVNPSPSTTE